MRRKVSRSLAIFVALSGAPGIVRAQTPHVYVVRLGADTVAIDRFIRTSKRIEGDLITRSPTTHRTHYVGELASDGSFSSFESYDVDAAGAVVTAVPRHAMTRAGDSVVVQTRRDTAISSRAVGAAGR